MQHRSLVTHVVNLDMNELADAMGTISDVASYNYQPLQSANLVRLIQVHPFRDHNDCVHISFHHTDLGLDRSPRYQTLSYTWGKTFPDGSHLTRTVFCEGKRLLITPNLEDFLKRLRRRISDKDLCERFPDYCLPIWIDALSINQNNVRERSQQVAVMASIYGRSTRVIIWLGESELLLNRPPFERVASPYGRFDTIKASKWTFDQYSWFERRWVVREVLHHVRDARLVWLGEQEAFWPDFLQAVRCSMTDSKRLPAHLDHHVYTEYSSAETYLKPDTTQRRSLLENLHVWDATKCSDDRDRIYSLLSISADRDLFQVDYVSDTEEVYYEIAKQIIRDGQPRLVARLLASAIQRHVAHSSFPSWIPDWRRPALSDSIEEKDRALHWPDVSARTSYHDNLIFFILDDGRRLSLKGWLLDGDRTSANLYREPNHTCDTTARMWPKWKLDTACELKQRGSIQELPQFNCAPCKLQRDRLHAFKYEDLHQSLRYIGETLLFWSGSNICFVVEPPKHFSGTDKTPVYRLKAYFPLRDSSSLESWCEKAHEGMTSLIIE